MSLVPTPTVTALECGRLRTRRRVLIDGADDEEVEIPIPAWLVRHRAGDVLFDAGLHPSLVDGPDTLGRFARLFTPDLAPHETVGHQLEAHGIDRTSRLRVVLSHSHFDHVGGLCELPNARLVVHRDEWTAAVAAAADAEPAERFTDLGHEVMTIDGTHDLFGDGTVTTLPTPGHTCGHQSLRVETAGGPVILAADACYFAETLDDGRLPPFGHDLDRHRRSLELLRRERAGGATVVPGHDRAAVDAWSSAERPPI